MDDGGGRRGAKTGWEHDPIYTESHVSQGRSREVYFGARARRAKIGRSEGGGSENGCRKREQGYRLAVLKLANVLLAGERVLSGA